MTTFNLGERIRQVRLMEAKMGAMEEEFDAKVKPLKDWAVAARAEILKYLLDTGQKSANTEYGGVHWKEKVTYRVEDKDEYRRHVIGTEQWELLSWAAAAVACEEYTKEHGAPPPGTVRNGVILPYITAPTKKATRVSKANGASAPEANPQE